MIDMQYAWFIWSLIILVIWLVLYLVSKGVRNEMLTASLWTAPFGLTEPLFVPEYWLPPSLFDLARNTGFDIESIIFSFAIGGIGSVLFNILFKAGLQPFSDSERSHRRHRYHSYTIFIPLVVFLALALGTELNHIYCGIAGMFAGALGALWCRPDLKKKIWISGLLFTALYFVYFSSLRLAYPDYVELVWNLDEISGILILGIPLEEHLFAFSFGMLWSSLYEHLKWYKLVRSMDNSVAHANV